MIDLEKEIFSNTINVIMKELEGINKLTTQIDNDSYNDFAMSEIRHNAGKILGKTDILINILKCIEIKLSIGEDEE